MDGCIKKATVEGRIILRYWCEVSLKSVRWPHMIGGTHTHVHTHTHTPHAQLSKENETGGFLFHNFGNSFLQYLVSLKPTILYFT